ncbi:uncharacterized protein LOC144153748 isoform X1 [Haemaphysalis longicornis]
MNAGDSNTYSRKIFSALGNSTRADLQDSGLHLAVTEPPCPPSKCSEPTLGLVAHYIKPRSSGGLESCVVVVDLARRFDVLALAQQVDEPSLAGSLSRLHLVHCPGPEALLCAVDTLLLSAVPMALLVVYTAPMHRWHGPQGNVALTRLQELALLKGARFYTAPHSARLRSRQGEAHGSTAS